jgi:hypothetical protein
MGNRMIGTSYKIQSLRIKKNAFQRCICYAYFLREIGKCCCFCFLQDFLAGEAEVMGCNNTTLKKAFIRKIAETFVREPVSAHARLNRLR